MGAKQTSDAILYDVYYMAEYEYSFSSEFIFFTTDAMFTI